MIKRIFIIMLMAVSAYSADVIVGVWGEMTLGGSGTDRILEYGGGAAPSSWTDTNSAALRGIWYLQGLQPQNLVSQPATADTATIPDANGFPTWDYADGMTLDNTVGDYISATNSGNQLGATFSNITFCGWFKQVVVAAEDGMLHIGTLANSQGLVSLFTSGGAYNCRINGQVGTDQTVGGTTTTNWTHIAITYDGTSHILYQEGLQVDIETGGYIMDASGLPFIIGTRYSTALNWNGNIDQIRLYNRTITSNEVFTLGGSLGNRATEVIGTIATNNILAYFPFTNDLLRAHDDSGNNNHVLTQPSFVNAPTARQAIGTNASGRVQYAFLFDGTDDHFTTLQDNSGTEFGTDEFTCSAWIKVDTHKDYNAICGKAFLVGSAGYGIYTDDTGELHSQVRTAGTISDITNNASLSTGTWYNVWWGRENIGVGTNKQWLAVDGVIQTDTAIEFLDTSNTEPFTIGAQSGGSHDFDGNIYGVRLYEGFITNYAEVYNNTPPEADVEERLTVGP